MTRGCVALFVGALTCFELLFVAACVLFDDIVHVEILGLLDGFCALIMRVEKLRMDDDGGA